MFAGLKRMLGLGSRPEAARHLMVSRPRIRAGYDAAKTTDENRRHWVQADFLGADAANSLEVRKILRSRSRYEVANNCYARGIVDTLAQVVVGTGPRLQLLTPSSNANRTIEYEFAAWLAEIGIADKLSLLRIAQADSGEGFGRIITNRRLATPVQLDLQLLECDRFTDPTASTFSEANIIDGVITDRFGTPLAYKCLRVHPGDTPRRGAGFGDYDVFPAWQVIHLFKPVRPEQHRGIPDLTPALPLFAELRRYTLAVIGAAETAAEHTSVIYSEASADADAVADVDAMDTIELERRMATVLPAGWKIGQLKAEQPTTTYGDFKNQILNEIGRCMQLPFNIAALDSSKYNYASGRLDHQIFARAISIERLRLERIVLERLFAAWLSEARLIDGYLPVVTSNRTLTHQWFWDGFDHVDPTKEASAQTTRLTNCTTTLADECAKQGVDWETQLRQRAKELALMRELELPIPLPQGQQQGGPGGQDGFEDEDGDDGDVGVPSGGGDDAEDSDDVEE